MRERERERGKEANTARTDEKEEGATANMSGGEKILVGADNVGKRMQW